MTNPDTSGMLRFLTDQLQEAEDAGDRGKSFWPAQAKSWPDLAPQKFG